MFMPVNEIIQSFVNHRKIERLFLKCTSVEDLNAILFDSLIKSNPQIVLIMIVVKDMPKSKLRAIQNILNKRKSSATQLFYCTQDENAFFGKLPIPAVHQYEIIKQETTVAVLDIFNGFL